MDHAEIMVEIIYAQSESDVFRQTLAVPPQSTIEWVINQSALMQEFPALDLNTLTIGIYSKKRKLTDVVKDGDRIEIYQPLRADAKQLRRMRKKDGARHQSEPGTCKPYKT